eukprot:2328717-Prymnesium_polylepis.1
MRCRPRFHWSMLAGAAMAEEAKARVAHWAAALEATVAARGCQAAEVLAVEVTVKGCLAEAEEPDTPGRPCTCSVHSCPAGCLGTT